MKDELIKVNEKLDSIDGKLHAIDITLIKQEVNIAEHIKRTNINEMKLEKFEHEIKPVLDSLKAVKMIFSILAFLASFLILILRYLH